ncbi:acyl dehydratase [Roseobacter insulae]|nr:acyl dehydratase [Roseobacter insulae]
MPTPFSQSDPLDPARAQALQATLGASADLAVGDELPPFFHQLYFWTPHPPDHLGRDGHPKTGGLIPDMGLPRRMWAGGRMLFHQPLRLGFSADRRSVCTASEEKSGRSGALGLVTLRHDIYQDATLCLTEFQDLIYREDSDPNAPAPQPAIARTDEDNLQKTAFDTTLLFRYSALTFNGHRIHYDEDYARNVEGYSGLVVHGPLLAQYLMLMAQRLLGRLKAFEFRATAPLMHWETAELCQRGHALWVRAPDGRQCMTATATPL